MQVDFYRPFVNEVHAPYGCKHLSRKQIYEESPIVFLAFLKDVCTHTGQGFRQKGDLSIFVSRALPQRSRNSQSWLNPILVKSNPG